MSYITIYHTFQLSNKSLFSTDQKIETILREKEKQSERVGEKKEMISLKYF